MEENDFGLLGVKGNTLNLELFMNYVIKSNRIEKLTFL
jgi:hypothetical protein